MILLWYDSRDTDNLIIMYSNSITLVVVVIGVLTCHIPRLLNTYIFSR